MKKRLVTVLTLLSVGSTCSGVFAAPANDVSDVPNDHWAYKAVKHLAENGIIDGYSDKTFQGNKTMNRYEMAQVVEKAMDNSNKATAKQKALIDKLASEFALEINKIDTRVTKVEKFTQSTLKVGFDSLITYAVDNPPAGKTKAKGDEAFMSRFRISFSGDLNEKTKFNARIGTSYGLAGMSNTTTAAGNANTNLFGDLAYFTFSNVLGFDSIRLGRQGLNELGGNLARKDNNNDGIFFEKKLSPNTTLRTGVAAAKVDNTKPSNSQDFEFISLNSKINKNAGVSALYFNNNINVAAKTGTVTAAGVVGYTRSQIGGVSAYQRMGKWTLLGEYDKVHLVNASNSSQANPYAYAIQLSTGKPTTFFLNTQTMCNINKPGDSAFTIAYHYLGAGAVPSGFTSWRNATANSSSYSPDFKDNVKGWAVDYQYTFLKGMVIDFTYQKLQYANTTGGMGVAGNKLDDTFAIAIQSRF